MRDTLIAFRPIGVIHSAHTEPGKTPVQPVFARGCEGQAILFPEFAEGLRDIEHFSHIHLIYLLHRADTPSLLVKPFVQDMEHGVFATRSPRRPNPIGMSIVELIRRDGDVLHLESLDILDGTPLLDIKPYTSRFDCVTGTRDGWQDAVDDETARLLGRRGYDTEKTS